QGGELAHPDKPLCRVINMDRMRVEGFVSTSHDLVQTGDKVLVLSGESKTEPDMKIPGTITFVDPEIDTITNQYKVWAEINNEEAGLRPGSRPEMVILKKTEGDKISKEVSVQ
ncbi:HlyD family efflux transporter periplasmic adaptor subunit, partial [Planctomicrobium sp.]|nr:HlyD family efflux transporter periplasmic adaptor subunit [Planctomicrobium sp.]